MWRKNLDAENLVENELEIPKDLRKGIKTEYFDFTAVLFDSFQYSTLLAKIIKFGVFKAEQTNRCNH